MLTSARDFTRGCACDGVNVPSRIARPPHAAPAVALPARSLVGKEPTGHDVPETEGKKYEDVIAFDVQLHAFYLFFFSSQLERRLKQDDIKREDIVQYHLVL